MNCNKDDQSLSLGKMQSPKQIIALQGTNGPWQKERAFAFIMLSFLQVHIIVRQSRQRQITMSLQ